MTTMMVCLRVIMMVDNACVSIMSMNDALPNELLTFWRVEVWLGTQRQSRPLSVVCLKIMGVASSFCTLFFPWDRV